MKRSCLKNWRRNKIESRNNEILLNFAHLILSPPTINAPETKVSKNESCYDEKCNVSQKIFHFESLTLKTYDRYECNLANNKKSEYPNIPKTVTIIPLVLIHVYTTIVCRFIELLKLLLCFSYNSIGLSTQTPMFLSIVHFVRWLLHYERTCIKRIKTNYENYSLCYRFHQLHFFPTSVH